MKALTITLLLTLALSTASYGVGETVEQTADSVAVQVARILAAQKDWQIPRQTWLLRL